MFTQLNIYSTKVHSLVHPSKILAEGEYKGYSFTLLRYNNVAYIQLLIPKRKRKYFNLINEEIVVTQDYIEEGKFAYRVLSIPTDCKSFDELMSTLMYIFSNIC